MWMSRVIGHRGAAGVAPENTLAGIQAAARLRVPWVELDVTLLGDGVPVLFHDRRLNRTTGHTGRLNSLKVSQLSEVDAGSWFAEAFSGERIPLLSEALSMIKTLGLGLNLELKPNGCSLHRLVDSVVDALKVNGFPEDKLLVSSFSHKALLLFRARSDYPIGCLFESLPRDWQGKAEKVRALSLHLNAGRLGRTQVSQVKAAGYELYCYTVNSKRETEQLMEWGVDGVFSDLPDGFDTRS